jgi:hypothetical protein
MSLPTTSEAHSRVATIGSRAAQAIGHDGTGKVLGVFERSAHIEIGGVIVCIGASGIGAASIGNGPFNALLEEPSGLGWLAALESGEAVAIVDGKLRARGWLLDLRGARTWRPEPWPPRADSSRMRAALDRVTVIVRNEAPDEGLVRLVVRSQFGGDGGQLDAMARIAVPRILALRAWLRDELVMAGLAMRPVPLEALGLLGLGPGLTPSGDDMLCGVLIGLQAAGAHRVARALADAVEPIAVQATTRLSCAFLSAAADGEGSEALHAFIAAVMSARMECLDATVVEIGRHGHTSGWDALAGVVMVLRGVALEE